MSGKLVLITILVIVLMGMLSLSYGVQIVEASETIYIRADGSVDPPTAPIQRDGDLYTLTGNLVSSADAIKIERDNMILYGAGRFVQGAGSSTGIVLDGRNNVTIMNTEVKGFLRGIYLYGSSNCSIVGNIITGDNEGLALEMGSNYNCLSQNNITENEFGVRLANSHYNCMSGNSITREDRTGIDFVASSNNRIVGNIVSENNESGIFVFGSYSYIYANNITNNNESGITIYGSNWNTITQNNIINNTSGISLSFTTPARPWTYEYNTIVGNNVAASRYAGIKLEHSSHNLIYHNNFVDNAEEAVTDDSPNNIWDNNYPFGGNCWSDYANVDSNQDGIGDAPYVIGIGNFDNYPLVGMFYSYNVSYVEQGLAVDLISNSSISSFDVLVSIEHLENRLIRFNATGESDFGFVRICIPHALMNEPYQITVNSEEPHYVDYTLFDNGTHRWIYFAYHHSTQEIVIVIEVPSFLILPLFMMATLLAVICHERRQFI